jgi:hypothetical protein
MCVVTALVALVNVNAYGDTPCGNWVSPNYPKTADFESERPYGLKTKTADESTAVACTNAIASKTPTIVIFGVTTLALLTVGVLRRYQPSGVGPRRDPTKFPLSGQVCSRSISRLRATASHSLSTRRRAPHRERGPDARRRGARATRPRGRPPCRTMSGTHRPPLRRARPGTSELDVFIQEGVGMDLGTLIGAHQF